MPRIRTAYVLGANTITGSGTSHVVGSWAELVASVDHDCSGINIASTVAVGQNANNTSMLLELGFGAASSEVSKVQWFVGGHDIGLFVHLPLHIPKGTRLSMRLQAAQPSDTYQPHAILEYAGFGWGGYAVADPLGLDLTESRPTVADLTDNAWEEVVASTALSYRALSLHGGIGENGSGTGGPQVEVGKGAAASEQVLGIWAYRTSSTETATGILGPRFLEANVAAGTRLALRKGGTLDFMAHLIGWR